MTRKILIAAIVTTGLLCQANTQAQDPHFSQYFTAPYTINPAYTGKGVSDWRANGIFRSQWWGSYSEPYNTRAISLEKGIATGAGNTSTLGFGVSFLSDASNGGLLKNNYASLHAAYNLALDANGNDQLGIGITGTYANRLLDITMFEYQSQFGSMGFQRSAASGDIPVLEKVSYFDVNAGLLYSHSKENFGYHLGAAIFHAARPEQGVFKNSTYSLETRYSFQAGMQPQFRNGDRLQVMGLMDFQGGNHIFTLGGIYHIKTNRETVESLNIGLWRRFGDAYVPYAGVEGSNWLAGVTYDVVTSSVKNVYSNVQSLELSFAWQFGKGGRTENSRVVTY